MTARSECECAASAEMPPAVASETTKAIPAVTIYALPDGRWQVSPIFREVPAVAASGLQLHEALLCLFYALDSIVTERADGIAP